MDNVVHPKTAEFKCANDRQEDGDGDAIFDLVGDGGGGGEVRLTPELIMRAELEVNEKDAWRLRDIEALREIVRGEPSLRSRLDDAFLLRFLRARRFDYDGAFRLICDYYHLVKRHEELFVPLEQLRCVFDANLMTVIPDAESRNGETIFLMRLGQWNPRKFSFDHIIAAAIMSMEAVIRNDVTQINGIVCVVDMTGFGWTQLRKFGPSQAKKVIHILDKCLPIRIKTIYVVNESALADIGFAIMRPFTSEELHDKMVFLGSNYAGTLHQQRIAPEALPEEFGGRRGPMDGQKWCQMLTTFEPEWRRNFAAGGYGFVGATGDAPRDPILTAGMDLTGRRCTGGPAICRSEGNTAGGGGGGGTDMKTFFRKSQTCNGYLFDYYNTSTSVD